jgi:hypothetical protein
MRKSVFLGAIAAAFFLATTLTATAGTVTANFDGGNGDAVADAYFGTAGGGWLGPWEERRNQLAAAPYTNFLVRTSAETPGTYDDDYAELAPGTGNYLYVDANLAKAGSGTVARNYTGDDGIDLTRPYTIDFLYRVEESETYLDDRFTTKNDRYQIFDYPTIRTGSTGGCGYIISAHGGSDDASWLNESEAGYWVFYDGKGHLGDTGYYADRQVNTGIALVEGQTLRRRRYRHGRR